MKKIKLILGLLVLSTSLIGQQVNGDPAVILNGITYPLSGGKPGQVPTCSGTGSVYLATINGLGRKVDSIWRKIGVDSIYFSINGTTHAIKDSAGGGAINYLNDTVSGSGATPKLATAYSTYAPGQVSGLAYVSSAGKVSGFASAYNFFNTSTQEAYFEATSNGAPYDIHTQGVSQFANGSDILGGVNSSLQCIASNSSSLWAFNTSNIAYNGIYKIGDAGLEALAIDGAAGLCNLGLYQDDSIHKIYAFTNNYLLSGSHSPRLYAMAMEILGNGDALFTRGSVAINQYDSISVPTGRGNLGIQGSLQFWNGSSFQPGTTGYLLASEGGSVNQWTNSLVSGFTATTQTARDNTTKVATDAYVDNIFNNQEIAYQALGISEKAMPIGANFMGMIGNYSLALASGTLSWVAVYIPTTCTITGCEFELAAAGSYTGNNYNGIGLYSVNTSTGALTLVDSTTSNANIWTATANTWTSAAFASTYAASPGLYMVGVLYHSSAQTTPPSIYLYWNTYNNAISSLPTAHSMVFSGYQTGNTIMPASRASSALTQDAYQLALYLY